MKISVRFIAQILILQGQPRLGVARETRARNLGALIAIHLSRCTSYCDLFLPFLPRYGSMSAHIRSTVALSIALVMGMLGAFSENISSLILAQFGEIASG